MWRAATASASSCIGARSSAASRTRRSRMTDLKFEDCLTRLEQIVSALEAGNLPLEESLKVFEEGISLARHCARYLDDAERRIEVLVKDEGGATATKPFVFEAEDEA